MKHYTADVDVRDDVKAHISMGDLVDIISEGLERVGFTEVDYRVEVQGPPELRIGVVMK